jgi:hypothetical protein
MVSQWTPEAIRALGATTDLPTLGSIFGLGRSVSYEIAQTGEWDQAGLCIIRIGTRYRVSVQSILEVLELTGTASSDPGHEPSLPARTQPPGSTTGRAILEPFSPVTAKGSI